MILLLFYIFHVHLKLRIRFSRKFYIWTYNLCALYSRYILLWLFVIATELAQNAGLFAKSAAVLGSVEEHTSLSRALSQLAEIEDKIDSLHVNQADSDFYILSEFVKDYIGLIQAVKVSAVIIRVAWSIVLNCGCSVIVGGNKGKTLLT